MTAPTRAFVVRPEEGTPLRSPVGGITILKTGTIATAGSFALLENRVPSRQGPPLHTHTREDEMWWVIDGHFRFRADDQILDAPEGSFVFVPRGTAHCFQNIGADDARILVMFTPSGMERFFEEHAAMPAGPVDPAIYREVAARNWMTVDGPPLAESDPL